MKPLSFVLPVVAFVGLFVPALSVSAQADDPLSILQQFVAARNQGDEPGAMALVAEGISYVGGSACPLTNPCTGPQAMREDVRLFISDHAQSTLIGFPAVSGTTVTARAETANDAVRAAGVDRVIDAYTAEVRDGKLTSFRAVEDASDAQTAAFQAVQRAQQPTAAAVGRSAPAARVAALNASPRVHDDWAVAGASSTSSVDVAPRTHDDWMLPLP
jgi:uncharacterized protein YbaA (DUF1428 family)